LGFHGHLLPDVGSMPLKRPCVGFVVDGADDSCRYCEIVKGSQNENNLYLGIVRRRGKLPGSSRANPLSHLHQVSERFGLHLIEQMSAVQLNRNFAEVQFRGDLFIQ